jgi:multisubunit Na+/H+ antiporter MnhE subunit
MPIIQVLVGLVVVGIILYLVNQYFPMDPVIKKIFTGIVILLVVLWLLSVFGLLPSSVHSVRIT